MAAQPEYSIRLSSEERERLGRFDHALDYVFSEEELLFLEENGYLVLRGIIPEETIDSLVQEALVQVEKQAGVRLKDESTWASIPYHGCFNIWHTKTYNQLRQHPLLYSVFAQLLKTGNLTVSVDRINLKAPCKSEAKSAEQALANSQLELHTDLNYWHANPNQPIYQGGLCLNDCPVGGGGFFCIPGFHRPDRVRQYMHDVNRGKFGEASSIIPKKGKTFVRYFDQVDADAHKVEVPLNKGDFVIWNNNLPHNGGKNSLMIPAQRSAQNLLENFRMHAFIMFVPLDGPCASEETSAFYTKYQAETRHSIMSGEQPVHFATRNSTPGKPMSKPPKVSSGALTPLGERILGIVPYEALLQE